jgi:hypothetical protein
MHIGSMALGRRSMFLDHLHADVEFADNVTSFYVRRCVGYVKYQLFTLELTR